MAETKNTLRQADNEVVVEGVLQEVRIKPGKSGAGKEYISGEIDVAVSEQEIHTFRVFSMKLKKDGSENGIYKGLQTVADEYLSVAKVGAEEADKVRITSGQMGINDYVGGDGKIKSYPQLSTNFINRVQANDEFEPKAVFDVELFVHSVREETDKEGEETGRVILKGYVPQYNGGIAPLEFVAEGEGADYIRDTYDSGNTVNIQGDIVNRVEVTKTRTEVAFGKPKENIKRKTTREFLITGGLEPYDEESVKAYKSEDIKAALAEREVILEGLLRDKKEKNKSQPKKEEKKGGFGAKKEKPAKTIDISDDDLPF